MSFSPNIGRKAAAEFAGTMVFVLVGAGSAVGAASLRAPDPASGILIAALANGIGLAVAVTATMAISGGALNPAVALGLVAGKKLPVWDFFPYLVAEVAGAIAAGLLLVAAFPGSLGNEVQWGSPVLSSQISVAQGILVELLLTFVLVMAVYGTAVDSRAPKVGGFGIGLAVLADVLVAGNLTGAAMNPARAVGPMLAGGFLPSYWYIYWVGPMAGAVIAGLVYRFVLETES